MLEYVHLKLPVIKKIFVFTGRKMESVESEAVESAH